MTRGRDVMSLMRLLPGVAYTADSESVGDNLGTALPNVQGGRKEWGTFNVDGMAGNDLGNPDTASSSTSMDAIAEVKVLLNNYQAEYGRNGGAFINVVTKSGTRDFHGSAYYFKRHEKLNANDFFNNRNGVPRPVYRHDISWIHRGRAGLDSRRVQSQQRETVLLLFVRESWNQEPSPAFSGERSHRSRAAR